jgi:hypothetical protein
MNWQRRDLAEEADVGIEDHVFEVLSVVFEGLHKGLQHCPILQLIRGRQTLLGIRNEIPTLGWKKKPKMLPRVAN